MKESTQRETMTNTSETFTLENYLISENYEPEYNTFGWKRLRMWRVNWYDWVTPESFGFDILDWKYSLILSYIVVYRRNLLYWFPPSPNENFDQAIVLVWHMYGNSINSNSSFKDITKTHTH